MASVGHDGSLRIWDLNTMQVINVIEDKQSKDQNDKLINSIAWQYNPRKPQEELLCFCTSAGYVKLVDIKKNKILAGVQCIPT